MDSSDISTSSKEAYSHSAGGDGRTVQLRDFYKVRQHIRPKPKKMKPFPEFSANWKSKHLAKLNIYYDKNYLPTPSDVLLKKGDITELSEMQKFYINKLKSYLQFDAVYLKNEQIHHRVGYGAFYSAYLKSILDDIRSKIKPSKEDWSEMEEDCNNYINVMAKMYVDDFIKELSVLMKTTHDYIKDSKTKVVEKMYSELFRSFANMCNLKPRMGEAALSYWHGLMGLDVCSKPEFRLCKKGICFEEDEDPYSVVAVVGMKKGDHHKDNEQCIRKRRKMIDCDSSDNSSPDESKSKRPRMIERSSSDTCDSSSTDENRNYIPEIEMDLNNELLGQHAVELLLDMRKYPTSNNKMPGIIVTGTKVFFTMLDMKAVHFDKLLHNVKLDMDKDIATVFYSKPLDILVEEDRNILIENFMRLNNIL